MSQRFRATWDLGPPVKVARFGELEAPATVEEVRPDTKGQAAALRRALDAAEPKLFDVCLQDMPKAPRQLSQSWSHERPSFTVGYSDRKVILVGTIPDFKASFQPPPDAWWGVALYSGIDTFRTESLLRSVQEVIGLAGLDRPDHFEWLWGT